MLLHFYRFTVYLCIAIKHKCNDVIYNYNREYKIFISRILLYMIECKMQQIYLGKLYDVPGFSETWYRRAEVNC